jgi:hypothetical protein
MERPNCKKATTGACVECFPPTIHKEVSLSGCLRLATALP